MKEISEDSYIDFLMHCFQFVKNKKLKDDKRSDNPHERKSIASAESSESENRHISPAPKSQSQANVIDKSAKNKADKSELDSKLDKTFGVPLYTNEEFIALFQHFTNGPHAKSGRAKKSWYEISSMINMKSLKL